MMQSSGGIGENRPKVSVACLTFTLVGTVHLFLFPIIELVHKWSHKNLLLGDCPMFYHALDNTMCSYFTTFHVGGILNILSCAQLVILLFQIAMAKLSQPHDHVEPGFTF